MADDIADDIADDDRAAYLGGEDNASLSRAERVELDEIRALLAEPAVWAEPSAGLEDRVVAAIAEADRARVSVDSSSVDSGVSRTDRDHLADGESGARPAGTSAPTIREDRPLPPISVLGDASRSRRPRGGVSLRARSAEATPVQRRGGRWPRYGLMGVAAAAIAGVGFALGAIRPAEPAATLAVALSGTPLAPGATGEASLRKTVSGWQIKLHATTLPRRDKGEYYEAWLKSRAGVLVPIGTFNEPTDVTLWAGVPPADFPTLTVTRQLADGNPASSGQVVLTGAVRPLP